MITDIMTIILFLHNDDSSIARWTHQGRSMTKTMEVWVSQMGLMKAMGLVIKHSWFVAGIYRFYGASFWWDSGSINLEVNYIYIISVNIYKWVLNIYKMGFLVGDFLLPCRVELKGRTVHPVNKTGPRVTCPWRCVIKQKRACLFRSCQREVRGYARGQLWRFAKTIMDFSGEWFQSRSIFHPCPR